MMDADVFISLTHFKGHEMTGMGGCLKNIGMGCGSRAGKMEMHNAGKPSVRQKACVGCGACAKICAHGAPQIRDGKCTIDHSRCVGCGRCLALCPKDAIRADNDESLDILNCKIAEYTKAVVDGRPCFHIALARDMSPNCDCHGENDAPITQDVGMFDSFDPVALDQACADAVNAQPALPGSVLFDRATTTRIHPTISTRPTRTTDWRACAGARREAGHRHPGLRAHPDLRFPARHPPGCRAVFLPGENFFEILSLLWELFVGTVRQTGYTVPVTAPAHPRKN